MSTESCRTCGAPTVFLGTYNGQREQFDVEPVTNPAAPESVRWYVSRTRGAVPATVAQRPVGEPFLMRHTCRLTREGVGDKELQAHSIAHSTGPRVPELELVEGYAYSYRWPTSWAHVVRDEMTLCGARSVLVHLTEAERRRLETMPVCPGCAARFRAHQDRRRA